MDSRNLLWAFDTEREALLTLKEYLAECGEDVIDHLAVYADASPRRSYVVGTGRELLPLIHALED